MEGREPLKTIATYVGGWGGKKPWKRTGGTGIRTRGSHTEMILHRYGISSHTPQQQVREMVSARTSCLMLGLGLYMRGSKKTSNKEQLFCICSVIVEDCCLSNEENEKGGSQDFRALPLHLKIGSNGGLEKRGG